MKEILDLWEEDELDIAQEGDWEIQYKDNACRETIVRHDDKFYRITESRSGSYYSDYEYDDPECVEVFPQAVTRIIYVTKP